MISLQQELSVTKKKKKNKVCLGVMEGKKNRKRKASICGRLREVNPRKIDAKMDVKKDGARGGKKKGQGGSKEVPGDKRGAT